MEAWTSEQVLGLAPDASSAKAALKQSSPSVWSGLGGSDRALWGLCQGSGAKPYQTAVDLAEPAFKCSCPSRKFPCKHALGLMLLWAGSPSAAAGGDVPEWAAGWLESRDQRAEKRARAPAAPADPEETAARAAKTAAQRERRVADGLAELRLWLDDLIRQGLAHAEQRGRREWEQTAARLVDAQAAGLARRVREMAAVAGSGPDWPSRLLRRAAMLSLLVDAYPRHEALPDGLRADVRALIGWTTSSEDLLERGERVADTWRCVGQIAEDDDRLRTRRTWLWGTDSRRYALLLDFAHPNQPLPAAPAPGQALRAELAFYPGAAPLRAQIAEREESAGTAPLRAQIAERDDGAGAAPPAAQIAEREESAGAAPLRAQIAERDDGAGAAPPVAQIAERGRRGAAALPAGASVAAAYMKRAQTLALNPWADRHPVTLSGVPVRSNGSWLLADPDLDALPLRTDHETALDLAAFAGGEPVAVFGEWTAAGVAPLAAWRDERLIAL